MTVAPGSPLRGTVTLPGDKSISHRTALFAALAEGESRIDNFLIAGVTRVMLKALSAMGVPWELDGTSLKVQGVGLHGFRTPEKALDCGNSGTTMRMLAGAIAASGVHAVLDGSTGLRRRPMDRIVIPMQQMGVQIQAREEKFAPLSLWPPGQKKPVTGWHLHPREFVLPIASAQVKSCLLLSALSADGPTTIVEPGPSRDHTERLLSSMGVPVTRSQIPTSNGKQSAAMGNPRYTTTIKPSQPLSLKPLQMTIPGDISAAAFLIVAALITPGSEITLQNVGLNPTRTGLLDALKSMGADIRITNFHSHQHEPIGDITVRHSRLHGTIISGPLVVRMIDEFPVFSIAAAHAYGPSAVRDAQELRYKESDRISTLCQQLQSLGVEVFESPDGFTLPGGTPPGGGIVDPHGDHRLAMSLAVAGLAAHAPVDIQESNIIHESFPGFKPTLEYLGAEID